MAKRVFAGEYTPTATADGVALADGTHMSIGASGATAGLEVLEIYMAGQATATTTNFNNIRFARNSIIGAGPTALASPFSDGPADSRTAALAAVPKTFTAATTPPQRSALTTAARLPLAFHPFGGIVLWRAWEQGKGWGITGITAGLSESSLSAFSGFTSSPMAAAITYEPL